VPPAVDILIPVLGRPHRIERALADALAGTPGAHVWFIASEFDLLTRAELERVGAAHLVLPGERAPGDYARKINLGVRETSAPLLFLGADDLHFHPGWLDAASNRISASVSVVGTNDLGNDRVKRGEHATHSLVAREYVEQGSIDDPSVLLHEGYTHNFVDDEFVATARFRRTFRMALSSRVEHLHPHWRKSEMDGVYELGLSGFEADRKLFRSRRRLWEFV